MAMRKWRGDGGDAKVARRRWPGEGGDAKVAVYDVQWQAFDVDQFIRWQSDDRGGIEGCGREKRGKTFGKLHADNWPFG